MAIHIDHKRFIVATLREVGTATPTELAAALPKKRKTKSSAQTMLSTLDSLQREGRVKKLCHGVYALAAARLALADGVAHGDPLAQAIVRLLAPKVNFSVHANEVYREILSLNRAWTRDDVMKSLRRLQRYNVVFKSNMHWAIRHSAIAVHVPDWSAKPAPASAVEPIDIFS